MYRDKGKCNNDYFAQQAKKKLQIGAATKITWKLGFIDDSSLVPNALSAVKCQIMVQRHQNLYIGHRQSLLVSFFLSFFQNKHRGKKKKPLVQKKKDNNQKKKRKEKAQNSTFQNKNLILCQSQKKAPEIEHIS